MQIFSRNRLTIEKEVYKGGINVALANIEKSKVYRTMLKAVEKQLYKQVTVVAHTEHVENLSLFAKAATPGMLSGVGTLIAKELLSGNIDLAAFLYWVGSKGGQSALDKLGIDGVFNLKNPKLLAFFDDHSRLILKQVDEFSKRWIAEKIQDGISKGLDPQEIVAILKNEGKDISALRAERIVITETANALVKVEIAAAMRYGIEEKIWRTSLDDRVDEICKGLEGKRVRINESFPGGYDGPPAHPICRCFIEEVVPDNWEMPIDPWLGE